MRPCWSPDSGRLAFGAGSQGRLTVMVTGLDEPEAKEVSPRGKRQVRPNGSPDGRTLPVQHLDPR
jgi:Tol biopolymer transport system component